MSGERTEMRRPAVEMAAAMMPAAEMACLTTTMMTTAMMAAAARHRRDRLHDHRRLSRWQSPPRTAPSQKQ